MTNIQELFHKQLIAAINKYSPEHIDIVVEDGKTHATYHSKNNSFGVSDTFDTKDLGGTPALHFYVETYDVGICEN